MSETRTTRYYENRTPSATQDTMATDVATDPAVNTAVNTATNAAAETDSTANTLAESLERTTSPIVESAAERTVPPSATGMMQDDAERADVSSRAATMQGAAERAEIFPATDMIQDTAETAEVPPAVQTPQRPEPVLPESPPRGELTYATEDDNFAPESNEGRIVVQVQTARGSYPVADAAVIIYKRRNGSNQVASFQLTDRSGATPEITVPAPPKSDAQSPSDSLPFADYNISVRHPMYYTAMIDNVQVFGDELTIQVVELIPLPEFVNETDITRTVTIPKQNL